MATRNRHIYEFGRFRLNVEEKQLVLEGLPVPLTPKAFDLLVVLVENGGHLLEKSELLDRVWPDSFVEEANLSVKMSELRRSLGESPNDHQYIETVPRRGYRFVAPVTEYRDEEAEPDVSASNEEVSDSMSSEETSDSGSNGAEQSLLPPLKETSRRTMLIRRWPIIGAGLLLLLALLIGLNLGRLRERFLDNAAPIHIQSLAVLPLKNLSGGETQDYFADGMTEALITDLARIGALRVISGHSGRKYKDTQRTVPEIGRELNADAVLTGSVVRVGDRVRIAVQLIHSATDQNLWVQIGRAHV